MSDTTQTTTESDGVLDTLEAKFDDFEERTGLDVYTTQTNTVKGVVYYTMVMLTVGSASAQTTIGSAICQGNGSGGLSGFINDLVSLLLGVGFLAAIYAVVRSGLKYMNAGGDPERKSQARESLVMSFVGIGLILFVVFLPGFLDNMLGSSTSIADCLKPF